MITLNLNSHNYNEAREKIEKTSLLYNQKAYPDMFLGMTRDGKKLKNLSDLDEHIENVGGGYCDSFGN